MYSGADTGILFTLDTLNYYRRLGYPIDSINSNHKDEVICNIDRVNEIKYYAGLTFGISINCSEITVRK